MNDKFMRLWATKNIDDEWWSSFVTAPLAIAFNYVAVDIKWLTPNLITLLSFFVAIVSALFIVAGGTANFIIAAFLIHLSHIFDCMDGQMARYRDTPSLAGSYFDRLTDQLQVGIWFGAVGYAAYAQSYDVVPIFLAFTGVFFYSLRGYSKYIDIHIQLTNDSGYLDNNSKERSHLKRGNAAGPGHGFLDNVRWLLAEQRKIFDFTEGVFIFMLSLALLLDALTPMLWVFAISQVCQGTARSWLRGVNLMKNNGRLIVK